MRTQRLLVGVFAVAVLSTAAPERADAGDFDWLTGAANWVAGAVNTAVGALESAANNVASGVTSAWSEVRSGALTGIGALEKVGKLVWDGIKAGVRLAIDQLQQLAEWAWEKIKSLAASAWNIIKSQPCEKVMDAMFGFAGSLPVPASVKTVLGSGSGMYIELFIQILKTFSPKAADLLRKCDGDCRQQFATGFICRMPTVVTDLAKFVGDAAQSAWNNRGICFGWGLLGMLSPAGITAPLLCGAGYWIADKVPKALACINAQFSKSGGGGGAAAWEQMLDGLIKKGCKFAGGKAFDLVLAAATGGGSAANTVKEIIDVVGKTSTLNTVFGTLDTMGECGEAVGRVPAVTAVEIQGFTDECAPRPRRVDSFWSGIGTEPLASISLAPDGTLWATTPSNAIKRLLPGGTWQTIPGGLRQVSTGGSEVWGVNRAEQIYRWNGRNDWSLIPGALVRVSVGADGAVWGVSRAQSIYRWTGGAWQKVTGELIDVAVGSASNVWGVSAAGTIWRYAGENSWLKVTGPLAAGAELAVQRISAASDGTVVVRTPNEHMWVYNGCGWDRFMDGTWAGGMRVADPATNRPQTGSIATLLDFSVAAADSMAGVIAGGQLRLAFPLPPPPPPASPWKGFWPVDAGNTMTSAPAVASWGPNRIDVFIRGGDSALWTKYWDGRAWSQWINLGGKIKYAPAVTSWGVGRLDVFAVGEGDALYHKYYDGKAWSIWDRLGGTVTATPGAVSWGPNRIDVFVRGGGGNVYQIYWGGASWSDFIDFGGHIQDGVAVSTLGQGKLDVFVRGDDSALWHKRYNGSWTEWENRGGNFLDTPSAVGRDGNRIDLHLRGRNNGLVQSIWQR